MASWFESLIDRKRWTNAWDSVIDLYALQITFNTSDSSIVKQSDNNIDYHPIFHIKSDEYKNAHEYWNGDIIDSSV
ncbi:unnamed protein product [Adineta steineri]|uniref:Uncharacterized protein n=1 Tax=Adineta steineri TaxID=433720 RepID=A0A815G6G9_9BILA|nr:unnamed protein product [Adineta steineri]CAF1335050.1 unnamed protein product [Adineta steineri]CAF1578518.1 unnamed protein product [Adineta steineri]CAF1590869.1 unnamed protein product [Adineta steineri]